MKNNVEIGIIGFGRFGKLLAKYLKDDFSLSIFDNHITPKDKKLYTSTKIKFSALEETAEKEIIILTVPISSFAGVLNKIKENVHSGSLIIDVCSVKEYPVKMMKKILPENLQILGTHPLFGPDSASDTLKGKKIILCPVRIPHKRYLDIAKYLVSKGLIIIKTTPEEHDQQTAWTLCLTHFIGNTLAEVNIMPQKLDTLTFRELLHIKETVTNDTIELFYDMQTYNPYAKKMREKVEKSMQLILKRIEKEKKKRI
jgi:prephenate dehydrogenase